ncbi:MAG: hypothetical protein IH595_08865 [Bacteroidales bacterium]|nr:hypothetical protein [Bacteroidales bacterium]
MKIMNGKGIPGIIAFFSGFVWWMSSCTHAPGIYYNNTAVNSGACSSDTVYFQNDVLPLLNSTCAVSGCHDASTGKEGIVLTDYGSVMRTGGIDVKNPSSSRIYRAITSTGEGHMPPRNYSSWTSAQAADLLTWISQGAKNNACTQMNCDTSSVSFSGSVQPILQKYCIGCHSGSNPSGGINMTNMTSLMVVVNNGSLMGSIRQDAGYNPMPLGGAKLSSCEIATIGIWVNDTTGGNSGSTSGCDTTTVTFKGSVTPILQQYCYNCHSGTASSGGGIDLSNYSTLATFAGNGSLMASIRHDPGVVAMPKGLPKLSSCDIATIGIWVRDTTFTNTGGGGGTGGSTSTCNPDTVYFQNTILPMLVSNCAVSGCHDVTTHKEGVQLTDYASIINTGGISPGNPSGSKLYRVITASGEDQMPPSSRTPLTIDQINAIKTWILQGALNNSCNAGCDTTNVTFSQSVFPIIQTYCLGCHNAPSPGGGIYLRNYADIITVVNNGKLWGAINQDPGFIAMPLGGNKLSSCDLATFKIWINNGAPNN